MVDDSGDFPWTTFLRNLENLERRVGSRERLAADTGISFWSLNSWRRQDHRPDLDALLRLCKTYDVTIDDRELCYLIDRQRGVDIIEQHHKLQRYEPGNGRPRPFLSWPVIQAAIPFARAIAPLLVNP